MTRSAREVPAGVVLAAGAGRRFGGPKALVALDGELLVERAAGTLRDGGCDPVVVVLGAEAARVRATARLGPAVVADNPEWATGMGSSLRAGLAAARTAGAPACVVSLVDTPLVTPGVVARLVACWRDGARAAVAAYGGRPRNPVLLDASTWNDVAAAAVGDTGARAWLRTHPEAVTLVTCDDLGSDHDVDTPADLTRLLEDLA